MKNQYLIACYEEIIAHYQDTPHSVYFNDELTPEQLERNVVQTYREWQSLVAHGNNVSLVSCYPGVKDNYASTCKKTYIMFSPANFPLTYFLAGFLQAIRVDFKLRLFEKKLEDKLGEYDEILQIVGANAVRELTDIENQNTMEYPFLKITDTKSWYGNLSKGSWFAEKIMDTKESLAYLVRNKLFKQWYEEHYSITGYINYPYNGEYLISLNKFGDLQRRFNPYS